MSPTKEILLQRLAPQITEEYQKAAKHKESTYSRIARRREIVDRTCEFGKVSKQHSKRQVVPHNIEVILVVQQRRYLWT